MVYFSKKNCMQMIKKNKILKYFRFLRWWRFVGLV